MKTRSKKEIHIALIGSDEQKERFIKNVEQDRRGSCENRLTGYKRIWLYDANSEVETYLHCQLYTHDYYEIAYKNGQPPERVYKNPLPYTGNFLEIITKKAVAVIYLSDARPQDIDQIEPHREKNSSCLRLHFNELNLSASECLKQLYEIKSKQHLFNKQSNFFGYPLNTNATSSESSVKNATNNETPSLK